MENNLMPADVLRSRGLWLRVGGSTTLGATGNGDIAEFNPVEGQAPIERLPGSSGAVELSSNLAGKLKIRTS
jgi:hypothetical protein